MKRITCGLALSLSFAAILPAADYYVSPKRDAGGAGTINDPWTLEYALKHPAEVKPGDTIWVRGGTYGQKTELLESRLAGTSEQPITLRQFPGERATLLGGLDIRGENTLYWGLEVFESAASKDAAAGTGNRLIHMVIHSREKDSIADQVNAYGSVVYDRNGSPRFTGAPEMSTYEPGRLNVIARRNSEGQLEFDPAALRKGDAFSLFDARDLWGPEVASGVYQGRPITVAGEGDSRLFVLQTGRKKSAGRAAGAASFLGVDTATQGNWTGVYGQDGNFTVAHAYAYPPYVSIARRDADFYTYQAFSTDPRALLRYLWRYDPSERIASYDHTITTMEYDITTNDGSTRRFAIYFCDYENYGRNASLDVLDTATRTLIDTRTVNYSACQYLVYNYSGQITLRIRNNITGTAALTKTAAISAIFWGGTGVPVVDTTPPTVSVTAPAPGTVIGTVQLSANASDNIGVASVRFNIDGTPVGSDITTSPYNFQWDSTTVANGTHSITATARDTSGLPATSAPVSVTVNNPPPDNTPPVVSFILPTGGSVQNTVNVQVNATDNSGSVAGVQLKLDGNNLGAELPGPGPTFNSSWNTTQTTNGSHQLSAVARDAKGNFTTATVNVTVANVITDTTPPTVSFTNPTGGSVAGTLNVSANAGDNVAVLGVQFKLDGANLGSEITTAPYQVSWNTTSVSDGSHTLTATARDAAGLTATATVTVTVANSAGTFVTFLGRDDNTKGNWRGVYGQDGQYIVYNYYGIAPYTSFQPVETNTYILGDTLTDTRALLKGTYHFSEDERLMTYAYNRDYFEIKINTYDNQAHRFAIYFCDYERIARKVTVYAINSDTGATLHQQDLLSYPEGVYFVYNYRGNVTFRVKNLWSGAKTEPNGNASGFFWGGSGLPGAQDTTNPQVSFTAPGAGATVSGTTNISVNASDNVAVAGVQLKLDGSNLGPELTGIAPYTYSWNTGSVGNGPHTLTATARDAAGNSATATLNVTVSNAVDTQAPTVSFTNPASGATVSGSAVTVSATASDDIGVVGVQFKVDGSNIGNEVLSAPYQVTWNTLGLTNGQHTLSAVARDASGKSTTATRSVTVSNAAADTTPPNISFVTPPTPANAATISGSVTLQANASDNVGVVGVQFLIDNVPFIAEVLSPPYTVALNTSLFTNGPHTLAARARDAAGLNTTASISVTINNAASSTSVTFLGTDANTKGNWQNVYGQDGNWVAYNSYASPAYAAFKGRDGAEYVYQYYSTDPRALIKPVPRFSDTERIASYIYASTNFSLDMKTTDNATHRVALYFADYENQGRAVTVEARDGTTGALLDSRVLNSYTGGVYLVYNYTGFITFRIVNNKGANFECTASAIFWGGSGLP